MVSVYSTTYNITPQHFTRSSDWRISGDFVEFPDGVTRQKYVVEQLTGDRYLNEPIETIRKKCLLLSLATPIFHPIGICLEIVNLSLRIMVGYHFWFHLNRSFTASLQAVGNDLCRIALGPILLIGLELSALYGLRDPYNGRKFYATCERFFYHSSLLATCFQPSRTDGYKRVAHQTCLVTE